MCSKGELFLKWHVMVMMMMICDWRSWGKGRGLRLAGGRGGKEAKVGRLLHSVCLQKGRDGWNRNEH